MNRYAAVWMVAAKLYDTAPLKLVEELFPGRHPSYIEEWLDRFARGLGYAVGKMDYNTFRRFADLCAEYEAEALRLHPDEAQPSDCVDPIDEVDDRGRYGSG